MQGNGQHPGEGRENRLFREVHAFYKRAFSSLQADGCSETFDSMLIIKEANYCENKTVSSGCCHSVGSLYRLL